MTAKRIQAVGLAVGLTLIGSSASAQEQPGYASNHFDPSERGSRWFSLDSLDIQGNGRLALGLINDYSYRSLVHYKPNDDVASSMVRNQYIAHLGAAVTLADRIRLGVSVPFHVFQDGHTAVINGVTHRPAEDVAVGDVRLSGDVRVLGEVGGVANLAAGVALYMPAGTPSAYTGDGRPRLMPRLQFAGQTDTLAYAARVGFMYRVRDEGFGEGHIGSQFTFGASVGALLANKKLIVGPEFFGSTVTSGNDAVDGKTTPLELLLGAHYDLGSNLRVGGGAGVGLNRAYGAPVARALLSLEWVPGDAKPAEEEAAKTADQDGDGIPDCEDACSYVAGPKSDDKAKNGCPASDVDGDGVPDEVDACPRVPGAASTDPKLNGCEADSDGDGVPDPQDACPAVAGNKSLDALKNGCPVKDQDGDGVMDDQDACPNVKGIKTNDAKTNGCEDPDKDKDGIPNAADACPDDAGKADPDPKKNGCPKAILTADAIKITDQVKFANNSAQILPGKDSQEILEAVLAIMKDHPEIKKIKVEGHTDDVGGPEANMKLSTARAAAVAKWLTDKGIAKDRISSEGFGETKPLKPNTSPENRKENRRVEFNVDHGGAAAAPSTATPAPAATQPAPKATPKQEGTAR